MKKNSRKYALLILLMTLLAQIVISQNKINVPKDLYKTYPDKEVGNCFLSANLSTNNCDSIFLKIKNNTNDTVLIVAYFVLEWPKDGPYMLFCLSDSMLRRQSNENGFDLKDIDFYFNSSRYLDLVDPLKNYANYEKLIFCDIERARQNKYYREIYPKGNVLIPIRYYYEDKYIFVRFQTRICIKNNWFWIQKETNSVFMPKCKIGY